MRHHKSTTRLLLIAFHHTSHRTMRLQIVHRSAPGLKKHAPADVPCPKIDSMSGEPDCTASIAQTSDDSCQRDVKTDEELPVPDYRRTGRLITASRTCRFTDHTQLQLSIEVEPGATADVGISKLSIEKAEHTDQRSFHVINVKDLVPGRDVRLACDANAAKVMNIWLMTGKQTIVAGPSDWRGEGWAVRLEWLETSPKSDLAEGEA